MVQPAQRVGISLPMNCWNEVEMYHLSKPLTHCPTKHKSCQYNYRFLIINYNKEKQFRTLLREIKMSAFKLSTFSSHPLRPLITTFTFLIVVSLLTYKEHLPHRGFSARRILQGEHLTFFGWFKCQKCPSPLG